MTGDYSNQHLILTKRVIGPQLEARSDLNVSADPAETLKPGGKAVYTEGKDEMVWSKQFYDVAQKAARAQRVAMPQFNAFRQRNRLIEVRENEKNNEYMCYADFRSDPVMNVLGAPSDKIEIYSRTIEGYQYKDCPSRASRVEPDERKGAADKDQLQPLTAHPTYRLHSQLNYAPLRKEYAIINHEPVTIHPDDAKAKGVAEGDLVRVWNTCGQALVGVHVSDGIEPGIICVHKGAQPGIENGICKDGDASVLTADIPTSELANGCAGNTDLVYTEKYTGEVPKLTVFDEPAIVTM